MKGGAPCRCRPGVLCLEDRRVRCYTNDAMNRKWRLRSVSHRPTLVFSESLICLSYTAIAKSGPSAWFRATVSRLSGGCSAIELRREDRKVVARHGYAPRSSECESAAL